MVHFSSKKPGFDAAPTIVYALLFLFFIQQITMLIEAIYMLNLLHTSMDVKALGVLFLFLPLFSSIIKYSKTNKIILVLLILVCIILSPVLPTTMRIFSSGIGAGLFLIYFGMQLSDDELPQANWGVAAALATLISITLRAIGHSIDISISGNTKFIGWILAALVIPAYINALKNGKNSNLDKRHKSDLPQKILINFGLMGIIGAILLIYFVISSPGVIARWTETNYMGIHLSLGMGMGIYLIVHSKIVTLPQTKNALIFGNLTFVFLLLATIITHRVPFPETHEPSVYITKTTSFWSQSITYLMLVLSPIIFINISAFSNQLKSLTPTKLAWPFIFAILFMIASVFILIFTNVWGYVQPVSSYFRNQFHLPFLLAGIAMLPPYLATNKRKANNKTGIDLPLSLKIVCLGLITFCCTSVYFNRSIPSPIGLNENKLTLMTYNIQQGVDLFGNKNYRGQLDLISEIDPDILCLQESDCSRISGGNSDVVRYFAEHLNYHTYYGPKTVSGTFGTAILSRFPLDSCQTVFTYSNKDEIGTAIAQISMGDQKITIINSHPAGNEKAKTAHIETVAQIAKQNKLTIALGDYNFRQNSPYYRIITKNMNDAWLSLYPDAIGPVDTSMLDWSIKNRKNSGGQLLPNGKQDMKNRIDHIFLSNSFKVLEAHYLPAPESETDHPAHWAVVEW